MITILGRTIGDRSAEDSDKEESASDVWLIQAAHRNISRFAIQAHPDLPQVGDIYFVGNDVIQSLRVKRRRLRPRDDSDVLWEMEVEYSSEQKEKEEEEENPLDKPPEIDIDFETYQTVAEGALLNSNVEDDDAAAVDSQFAWTQALTNSANEPFDPQPEVDQVRPVLNVTYNEAFLNIRALMFYANRVNSVAWLGCPPRTWKMGGPRIHRVEEAEHRYWTISLSFTFNKQTWDLQLLNQGTYYLDAGGDKQPFLAGDDRIIGLLDAAGAELAANANPTFERYRVYREGDFNEIFTDAIFL